MRRIYILALAALAVSLTACAGTSANSYPKEAKTMVPAVCL